MKICVLSDGIPPEGKGGAERVAWELARAYAAAGHDVLVVTTTRDSACVGESLQEGVRVIRIHSTYHGRYRAWRSLYNPHVIPELRRILAEFKPEIVHAHTIHAYISYAALGLAKRSGARVFLTAHDVMLFHYGKLSNLDPVRPQYRVSAWQQLASERFRYNPFRNRYIRRALRNVEKIIAVSDALVDALRENLPAPIGNKIITIHNGIDANAWECPQESVDAFKKELGIGEHTILFGGRLSGAKGGGALLGALPHVLHFVPDAQLVVMGERNEYAERMLANAAVSGSAAHIIFTGYLAGEELHAAYHAAAVVCVPSLCFETFGMMAVEAMVCAKPVVATPLGGLHEVVEDGVTGILANPHNPRALAGALVAFLQDPALAREYGAAGRTRVAAQFSLTHQTEQYLALFA